MINIIKTILEEFVCKKFINEKFRTLDANKDTIFLHSKYTSIKGCKETCEIGIDRDLISLHTKKNICK